MPRKTEQALQKKREYNRAYAARKKAAKAAQPSPQPPIEEEEEGPQGFVPTVESAPEQTFESGGVLQDILGALGLKGSTPGEKKKPVAARLTKQQQEFCDNITPIGVSMLMASLAWAWGRLGEAYQACAPTADVATRIVEPLIRIYARSAKFVASLDPNTADWLAALTATVGYAFTSLTMFDMITAQLREQEEMQNGRGFTRTYESGYSSANGRRPDTEPSHDAAREQAQPSTSPVSLDHLSERERSSYEALSKLRDRDIAARQRRSGQYGLS